MKKPVVIFLLALSLCGVASTMDSPAAPPGMDSCTAAIIGHSVAAFNWANCRSAEPPQSCNYEELAARWAAHQVLLWCFAVET